MDNWRTTRKITKPPGFYKQLCREQYSCYRRLQALAYCRQQQQQWGSLIHLDKVTPQEKVQSKDNAHVKYGRQVTDQEKKLLKNYPKTVLFYINVTITLNTLSELGRRRKIAGKANRGKKRKGEDVEEISDREGDQATSAASMNLKFIRSTTLLTNSTKSKSISIRTSQTPGTSSSTIQVQSMSATTKIPRPGLTKPTKRGPEKDVPMLEKPSRWEKRNCRARDLGTDCIAKSRPNYVQDHPNSLKECSANWCGQSHRHLKDLNVPKFP
uniref:Uncharacterized protein n=1 Tax=Romanomermis culicivorax TaxID=13658 RepID=A0A915K711_ROMCU